MQAKSPPKYLRETFYGTCLFVARATFFAALACICYWVLYFGSRFYSEDKYWVKSDLDPVYGCVNSLLAPACKAQELLHHNILFLWLAPTVLALAATAILILQPLTGHVHSHKHVWLERLLWPRRFWLYWCGGLTIKDLLIVAFWAAANAVWLSAILLRAKENLAYRLAMFGLTQPTPSIMAKVVARAFGSLLAPNLVMLFYPVSRGSVVLQALGISYPAAIRYHRWLGHAVLTFVLLHGGMYWSAFIYDGVWVQAALSRDEDVNHLMGSIAFVFAMALWLSALEVSRRHNYVIFKTMHHVGFWGFLVFGCCHYWGLVWYFLPGLMLYAVDAVYRLHQVAFVGSSGVDSDSAYATDAGNSTLSKDIPSEAAYSVEILHADISTDGSMCSLVLHIPQYAAAANGFIWLCVPEVSWFAYHPYTYVAVPWWQQQQQRWATPAAPAAAGRGGNEAVTAVVVHIKGYNRWSKKLVALVAAKGKNFRLKVQGPYAELPGPVMGHKLEVRVQSNAAKKHLPNGVIIIAGGNGVTEAFSVLSELCALGRSVRGLPAILIWSCRHAGEFEFLAPRVVAMARAAGVQLTTKLYFTSPTAVLSRKADSSSHLALKPSDDVAINITTAPSNSSAGSSSSTASSATYESADSSTYATFSAEHDLTQEALQKEQFTAAKTAETSPPAAAGATVGSKQAGNAATVAGCDETMMATSSLCPVVALGSFAGTAVLKFAMQLVMFVGAFCALLLARYITIISPGYPLPTDKMAAIHLGLIIAFMLVPGFIILWTSLLFVKKRHNRKVTRHQAQQNGKAGDSGGFAAAGVAMANAITTGSCGKLVPVADIHSSKDSSRDTQPGLQLVIPEGRVLADHMQSCELSPAKATVLSIANATAKAEDCSTVLDVYSGRPPVNQLVQGWLRTLQQLPQAALGPDKQAGSSRVSCAVYAMGPPALVASAQQMCDDVNRKHVGQKQRVAMHFERKTHEL